MTQTEWKPRTQGILEILPEEISDFETQVARFRAGEWSENDFMAFRLRQGVYGQRQMDAQMFRIKCPFGGLNADQMDALGVLADEYAPLKKGHVTTRENFQFHHIRLEDGPAIMRLIGDVGLEHSRSMRQHRAQCYGLRHRGRLRQRAVRRHALRGSLCALLRAPSVQPGPAAQGQERVLRLRQRLRHHAHPRCRLPSAHSGWQKGLQDGGRRRHFDYAAHRAHAVRIHTCRRVPKGYRGASPHLPSDKRTAPQSHEGAHQVLHRPHRHRRVQEGARRGNPAALGAALIRPHRPHVRRGRVRWTRRRSTATTPLSAAIPSSSTG